MKKLLFLHSGAELYGADIVMLELIKRLDKQKFNIHVLLPSDGPLVKRLKNEKANVEVLDYPVLRRKYFNLSGIIKYIYNYYKYSKKIAAYCLENEIDVVHVNTSAVLEGCYIKKKIKIPVVWHIHEILTNPRIVIGFMFKKIAKYADKVVCVSDAVKENFEKIAKPDYTKMITIYNGVDNEKFKPNEKVAYLKDEFGVENNDIIVGMIGRVNAWKGQKDFIEAMNLVFERCSEKIKAVLVGGVFIGQEWRMAELKNLIKKSKFKNNFVISDFRENTQDLYNLFDVFVLPSVKPDPLPTVVLEAMASGKPIVGYKHGGICEMVIDGENGFLAEVGNIEDLAGKIEKLIKDRKMRGRIGSANLERQKACFSMDSYVGQFKRVYEEV